MATPDNTPTTSSSRRAEDSRQITLAEVREALDGLELPASADALTRKARASRARQPVVEFLRKLDDRALLGMEDIRRELERRDSSELEFTR